MSEPDAIDEPDLRDPEVVALLRSMHAADPAAFQYRSLAEARATLPRRLALRRGLHYEPPSIRQTRDRRLGGVPVRFYEPLTAAKATLVWFHGGGWRLGGIETHDAIMRRACNELSAVVVGVGYRLAPEHPFPAALDDGASVVAALQAGDITDARLPIVVGGDSSGGQMAASLVLSLGESGTQVDGLALMYPALDATLSGESYVRYAEGGGLSTEGLRDAWASLLQGHDPTDPRASPLLAPDVSALPPTVILNAEIDPVAGDGLLLHQRLTQAGVVSTHRSVPGLTHAFMGMDGTVARAHEAVSRFWEDVSELVS